MEAATRKYGDWWASRQRAIAEERRRQEQEVIKDVRPGALEDFIARQAPWLKEDDIDQYAEWVRMFGGSVEAFREGKGWAVSHKLLGRETYETLELDQPSPWKPWTWFGPEREVIDLNKRQSLLLERLLELIDLLKRQGPRHVHYYGRYHGPDAASKRERSLIPERRFGPGADVRIG